MERMSMIMKAVDHISLMIYNSLSIFSPQQFIQEIKDNGYWLKSNTFKHIILIHSSNTIMYVLIQTIMMYN